MRTIQHIRDELLNGGVIVDIGQITKDQAKQLDKWVKMGQLAKWRGYWYPNAGANFGIGPLKSCWGLPEYLNSPFVSNPSPRNRAVPA